MSSNQERRILALYAGGTLGMVHSEAGYAPFPGFLTETLRTQSRFHDPHGDSIFSWSDTASRFSQWSEAYSRSRPPTRPTSPHASNSSSNCSSRDASPSPAAGIGSSLLTTGPPFSKSITVLSSDPKGTSTRNAVSQRILPDGTLSLELPSLITPKSSHNQQRIRYTVLEYDPLLDSSEMGLEDWTRMARDIELNYANFDAFVVLHGTDTMSFTASAMSFLLENLGKTVIVTGAQVPLSELRNDAIENVLGALILASTYIIPEVCLFFASTLYRGNRTSKVSNNALSAFDSPNLPPLARVGIGIDVAWNLVERSRSVRPFRAHDKMCSEVALLRLFPGMPTDTIKTFLSSNIKGLCIESFGAGNAPSRPDLLQAFQEATDRGVVIVNITQCLQGKVSAIYALGKKLAAVGVVAGADLTPECALTKLAYLLSKPELTRQQVRELMGRSLRGELTARSPSTSSAASSQPGRSNVSDLLARILQKPSEPSEEGDGRGDHLVGKAAEGKAIEREIADAERAVLPYLIHRAASRDDVSSLEWHLSSLTQLSSLPDAQVASSPNLVPLTSKNASSSTHTSVMKSTASGTTTLSPIDESFPLHVACAKGHIKSISLLLNYGASVHLRDYDGRTPLWLAARHGHLQGVRLLREAGAHLSEEDQREAQWSLETTVTTRRGAAAGEGGGGVEEEKKLRSLAWREAGVDTAGRRSRTHKKQGSGKNQMESKELEDSVAI